MSFNINICGKVCLSGAIASSSINNLFWFHAINIIKCVSDTFSISSTKILILVMWAIYNPTEGKLGIAQVNALEKVWKGGAPAK